MTSPPTPKPWIDAIQAYIPGPARAADGRELVKLSANENPLGCSPSALEALAGKHNPARYPDPDARELRSKIGEFYRLNPTQIVCGTGSDELLNLAAQAYAGPGDEVLFSRFSFSVYDIAARRCGATPVVAPDADYGTDADALLALVSERTRVVFLANPNNPTGTFMSSSEVAALHAALPKDVLLVLDQAYAEYLTPEQDDGGLELAARHDNVLVTRTFSKIYGLAGERIGWAYGAPDLIASLNRIRGPFNVTNSGQAAAIAAIGDQDFVTQSRKHNAAARAQFAEVVESLGNHGLRAVPSEANFVLVLFEGSLTAEAALAGLNEAGYAVRHLPGQGLAHALRITIGCAGDMQAISAKLRAMCQDAK